MAGSPGGPWGRIRLCRRLCGGTPTAPPGRDSDPGEPWPGRVDVAVTRVARKSWPTGHGQPAARRNQPVPRSELVRRAAVRAAPDVRPGADADLRPGLPAGTRRQAPVSGTARRSGARAIAGALL